MKEFIRLVLAAAMAVFVLAACDNKPPVDEPTPVAVTDVSIDPSALTLEVGSSHTLVANVIPENATNKRVNWTSTAPGTVSINSDGVVTAIKAGGPVYITVATIDGGKTDLCEITIVVPVERVSLDRDILNLIVGQTETLIATVLPEEASVKTLTWKSSDISVATVTSEGEVKGIKEGNTVISVTSRDGNFKAECAVNVSAYEHPTLGKISFRSSKVTDIGTQRWSDVVMATACKKDSYDGGDGGNFKADCRQSPGHGDLFSWEAVRQYKDVLCPGEWKVPVGRDFAILDMTLNDREDSPEARFDEEAVHRTIEIWGGEFGGYADNNSIGLVGETGVYWAQDVYMDSYANGFGFRVTGDGVHHYFAQNREFMSYGMLVRCVKNI